MLNFFSNRSYPFKISSSQKFYCSILSVSDPLDPVEYVDKYHELGDLAVWNFASQEEVTSIVGEKLRSLLGESFTPKHWLDSVQETEKRISLYMKELDRAADALSKHGIKLVALKNSGIARALHTSLASTPMGDVDVLVSPKDFRHAHRILVQLGFQLDDRSPFSVTDIDNAELHGGAEYRVPLADGSELWFELQWRPVAGRWIRPDQEPVADDLLDRSVVIPGTSARLLSTEDNLLQVCLHTAKHSYVRAPGFRLHTDVDRIVHYCEIDWDSFCSRVERSELRTAVYISLLIPKLFLGTDIPPSVLRRLNFFPFKHRLIFFWIRRVGLFEPNRRKWSKLGYIVFSILLYDTFSGLLRSIFPDSETLTRFCDVPSHPLGIPFAHAKRLFNIIFTRAST